MLFCLLAFFTHSVYVVFTFLVTCFSLVLESNMSEFSIYYGNLSLLNKYSWRSRKLAIRLKNSARKGFLAIESNGREERRKRWSTLFLWIHVCYCQRHVYATEGNITDLYSLPFILSVLSHNLENVNSWLDRLSIRWLLLQLRLAGQSRWSVKALWLRISRPADFMGIVCCE
jgi:hypothetical protein